MSDKFARLMATWFYVGDFPVAPGTMASAVGMLICFILSAHPILYILFFVVITYIGFRASDITEGLVGTKDPSCVVIDEVAGVMIAFFLLPVTPPVFFTAFFLFRAFDMFKIYPVNKFEEMKGGVGIMMDDLFAGLYTNIIMHLAIRFAGV
ncbi:MAG: hypothetical protein A2Y03_09260 [Omnitrophica WOR_2 bacterium GWF2_38_59]|nr:MAG: hypothetical protein A2Y03_09260 [Omnitrophica WOR_2 bacterium GWF2_38_59]OGX50587.1 MAG: hypothetical protein A2267_02880 [Omnitrophica WOR_2 bacterium RIFOXYA12_FULL_38_10]OGX51104.1 MAG: hypothetical protein A2243_08150 [Omnitrophica WOR_2 bacterium RIFOXYA2_FULL_38_17]OGX56135.1 MAG: hypothetical protein A2447_07700 [Omnitrophica WOR_2 bacterium RIFOXYC2_FULL_38_12]OGX60428.1 MAG: hypothetical protein A2306_09260 [Omnitrophica WOR_2 bacterium RIFOXYB2_FULL_38_16]HBG60898.1 phosphat